MARVTGVVLTSLESIAAESTRILAAIDGGEKTLSAPDRREVKRRVIEVREKVLRLIEELSAVRLEDPRN